MERVLSGLQWHICLVYLDDVIVVGTSFEEMVTNLRCVLSNTTLCDKDCQCT